MVKLPVFNMEGSEIGEQELPAEIFEVEVNESVIHQVIQALQAAKRKGTAATKTRKDVRGGGTKPWRQKGTGRARAGSIRSPIWRGGGVVFGPSPRSYVQKVPRKMKKAAMRSALSAKVKDNELIIVDKFVLDEPKTRMAKKALDSLKVEGKSVVLIARYDGATEKSVRNIARTRAVDVENFTVYDALDNDHLVISQDALEMLTGGLA